MTAKILYATMTGHSKKIANAIGKAYALPVHHLKTNPDIGSCDLLLLVSGIYEGESSPELLAFAKTLNPAHIKQVVLITTSTRGKAQGSLRATLEQAGIPVAEAEHHGIGGFLVAKMFRPNQADTLAAVTFAGNMLKAQKADSI